MYVCKVVAEALMSVFRIFGTETLNPIFYKLGLLASKLCFFYFFLLLLFLHLCVYIYIYNKNII